MILIHSSEGPRPKNQNQHLASLALAVRAYGQVKEVEQ